MSTARNLSRNDERLLWSLSGGYCACPSCNCILVFEDAKKPVSIGEVAHVIAHSRSGPRGEERLSGEVPEDEIDSYKNTILLCRNCHRRVDQNPEHYTADLLFQWKRDHENRVKSLKDRKNAICLFHKTKGPPIDSIKAGEDLSLNFIGLVSLQEQIDNQPRIDWTRAVAINRMKYQELMKLRNDRNGDTVVVLALSPIPMLIHLGSLITDTIPVEIIQFDRDSGAWVREKPDVNGYNSLPTLKSAYTPAQATCLAVSFSVTSPIDRSDINAVMRSDYDLLELTLPETGMNRVLYRDAILTCKRQLRRRIETVLNTRRYDSIHLFYAGPAGLAVEIGRCINTNTLPRVHTYHYRVRETPRYELAITI